MLVYVEHNNPATRIIKNYVIRIILIQQNEFQLFFGKTN